MTRALLLPAALLALAGCVTDAGCLSYAEARLNMPRQEPTPDGGWGLWLADLDDRMTGTCR